MATNPSSWAGRHAIGGIAASKIDAQVWYALANLGTWLQDAEWLAVGIETSDDLSLRYRDRGPEEVQVKAYDLSPAEIRLVLGTFAQKESAAPGHYSGYKLVARSFGGDFNGLDVQVGRLRLSRTEASDGAVQVTEDEVHKRVDSGIRDSISRDLFIDKVDLEHAPTSVAAIAESHCKEGLRNHFGSLNDVEAELAVKKVGDRLRELRVQHGGSLTRNDVSAMVAEARRRANQQQSGRVLELQQRDFSSVRDVVSMATHTAAQDMLASRVGATRFERRELPAALSWIDSVGAAGGALFVIAESGQGKSILLAQVALRISEDERFLGIWIDLSTRTSFPQLRDFELSPGILVGDVIDLALANEVTPLIVVDTLDAIDAASATTLLGNLERVAVMIADRPGHFRAATDNYSAERDKLQLDPLTDDEKHALFGALAEASGVARSRLTPDELRATQTPQDIKWLVLALSTGATVDMNAPAGLIRSIWGRTITESTDRSFVSTTQERRLVAMRKQQIVYELGRLSLSGALSFTDRTVLQLAGSDPWGAQALAELLSDGVLTSSSAGFAFGHAGILEWARAHLTLQDPSLLTASVPRETFEAEYSETLLVATRCLEDGDDGRRCWQQLRNRLQRGDNRSILAAVEVLFEKKPCLFAALPDLLGVLDEAPQGIRREIINRIALAYRSADADQLIFFEPVLAQIFGSGGNDA